MASNTYNGFTGAERSAVHRFQEKRRKAGHFYHPKKCEVCGQGLGIIHRHLEDYRVPVRGLLPICYFCHMMIHCRFRNPERFATYRDRVLRGGRIQPGNWGLVKAFLSGADLKWEVVGWPPVDHLGEIAAGRRKPSHPRKPKTPAELALPFMWGHDIVPPDIAFPNWYDPAVETLPPNGRAVVEAPPARSRLRGGDDDDGGQFGFFD